MKTFGIVVLGIVLGGALGLGIAWARFHRGVVAEYLPGAAASTTPTPPKPGEPQPVATIAEESHDFGDIESDQSVEHFFQLTNTGLGPLRLEKGGTTCGKCTLSDLPQETLAPGESEQITVSYRAHDLGQFRQSAIIFTNDPAHPRLSLGVSGKVISSLHASPPDLVFTRVSTTEPSVAETHLLAFGATPLEVTAHEFLEPTSAAHFRAEFSPLANDEVAKAAARSGIVVKVTVLPGLPVGAVRQKLRITTNQPQTSAVDVPIQGSVESDLSIVGAGWDRERGVLTLGAASRHAGLRREVFVLARGPRRDEVRLTAGSRNPEWIQVEIGEPRPVQQGAVMRWPVTVIIPPESPESNHLGTVQGKLGSLVLDTGLADGTQVKMFLQFLLER